MQVSLGFSLLFVLVVLCTASYAAAEGDDEAARVHFQSGLRYFDRGEYEDAAREFSAAFEQSGRPELLYNLYLAYERLGRAREASSALEGYLAEAENVAERERLETRLEALRRRAAQEAEPEAPEEPVEEAEPRSSVKRGVPLPALISFGVAGAGLSVFVVSGGLTLGEDRALADRCGANAGRFCSDADLGKLSRRAAVADVGLAVTAVGTVTGLVLYFVLRERGGDASTSSVRVRPAGGGIAVHF